MGRMNRMTVNRQERSDFGHRDWKPPSIPEIILSGIRNISGKTPAVIIVGPGIQPVRGAGPDEAGRVEICGWGVGGGTRRLQSDSNGRCPPCRPLRRRTNNPSRCHQTIRPLGWDFDLMPSLPIQEMTGDGDASSCQRPPTPIASVGMEKDVHFRTAGRP